MTIGEFFTKCETEFCRIVIVNRDSKHFGYCYKTINDIPKDIITKFIRSKLYLMTHHVVLYMS